MTSLRVGVRVKPGASHPRVGGAYGEGELVVAVSARPVDGAANSAVVSTLATALGLRRADITIVSGQTSRSKVVELDLVEADVARVEAQLVTLRQEAS